MNEQDEKVRLVNVIKKTTNILIPREIHYCLTKAGDQGDSSSVTKDNEISSVYA